MKSHTIDRQQWMAFANYFTHARDEDFVGAWRIGLP